jgi:hypothetical protein
VRLVDVIFRGGHLSEQALVEAVMTGDRPAHFERCDICAERAVELGRWLDQVRATAIDTADVAFPPERLAAQQQQILRRLEQLDQPARVIAFPNQDRLSREMGGRRVAAGWLAVAAAAGVLLGVISSQATERLTGRTKVVPTAASTAQTAASPDAIMNDAAAPTVAPAAIDQTPSLTEEIDRSVPASVEAMASFTPRQARFQNVSLTTRKVGGGK